MTDPKKHPEAVRRGHKRSNGGFPRDGMHSAAPMPDEPREIEVPDRCGCATVKAGRPQGFTLPRKHRPRKPCPHCGKRR